MHARMMTSLVRALAIGSIAMVGAVAPMSAEEHTETVLPQEIGTMTADGMLVYSMNHCIVTMTTHCEVSMSTGPPVEGIPGDGTSTVDVPGGDYPVPTGEPDVPGEPSGGEPTVTDTVTTPVGPTESGITASETGESPSTTDDGEGTPTDSAATGTATAGAPDLDVALPGFIGLVVMVGAFLI